MNNTGLISKILNSSYKSIHMYIKKNPKTQNITVRLMSGNCCLSVSLSLLQFTSAKKKHRIFSLLTVLFKVLQRNRISIYIPIFIMNIYLPILCCKELAHIITDPEEFSPAICKLEIYVPQSKSEAWGHSTVQSKCDRREHLSSSSQTGAGRTNSSFFHVCSFQTPKQIEWSLSPTLEKANYFTESTDLIPISSGNDTHTDTSRNRLTQMTSWC